MKNWYAKSIRNKITTVVLAAVVPALLLVSAFSALREAEQQSRSFSVELTGIASALGAAVSEPLASGDARQVANALKGIAAIPDITHVDVRDMTGRIVFQFGNGIVVNSGAATSKGLPFSLKTMPVEADVKHAGQVIGKLLLIADASKIRAGLVRSLLSALATALVATCLGIVASSRMQASVSRPLLALKHAMSHVRETKDFSHSVSATSTDETAQLVDAFNDMMGEIRQRDNALAEYREGLESKVSQRTRELAVAVDEAQTANRAKSDFLATMSHEIRTPMNGMLVMAELLAASELNPRAQRHCEVILRSGQTLLAIINDILDLSKIEAGKLSLERLPCGLEQIVDDVLKLFSERASSKGLELAAYVAPDVPSQVYGDPVRLSQIISNLVNNAIKFTERGGVVVSIQKVDAKSIRISVCDTGIGIAPEKLPTIFDPFTQAELSTTRKFGGTGIGLTICRKLVQAMGGTLKAESTLGLGSTFIIEVSLDPVSQTSPDLQRGQGIILTGLKDGPVLDVVRKIVSDHGFEIANTDDVHDASEVRGAVCLPATGHSLESIPALDGQPHILLTHLGQSVDAKVGYRGPVVAVEIPFAPRELHEILNAIAAGKPVIQQACVGLPTVEAPTFKGIRALAADDSAINREVLKEALQRLGITVTCVDDGAQAVEAVKAGAFDILFMDGSMPVLDGFEATRQIRRWESGHGGSVMPIIGLSAHVIGEHADAWRECGMSDFVSKPFTLAAIRACLARWVAVNTASNDPADAPVEDANSLVASAADQLLDFDVLQSVRDMQPPGIDLIARIVRLYAEHAPALLSKILDGENLELSELASAAHALKSISRNVGALRVGNLCGAIEDAARMGRCELGAHRDDLSAALQETILALSRVMEPESKRLGSGSSN